jgi:hypothetical protein
MPAISAMQDDAPWLAAARNLRLNKRRAPAGAALPTPATFAGVPGPVDSSLAAA